MNSIKIILGFDFGMKSIGIAVGQCLTGTASPLTAIKARDGIPDWDHLQSIIDKWQADILIVGLPLNMDGTEQQMTAAARRFGNRLHERFKLPVEWVDERLSTYEALDQMGIHSKMNARKRNDVDQLAAQLILQSWLNQQ